MTRPPAWKRTIMETRPTASSEDARPEGTGQGVSPAPAFSMFAPPDVLSAHGAPGAPPACAAPLPLPNPAASAEPAAETAKVPLDPETQKLVDRALFKIKAILFGSFLAAAGVMALLMTADALRPLRLWLDKRHADDLGWRIEWGILGGLPLWMSLMWLAARAVRWSGRKEREKAMREGTAQAVETARKFQEKLLEDLRQGGASTETIAEMRATFEETRRKNQAQTEARIKDWAAHPEHMQAELERMQAEIAARQVAESKPAPANPA